MKFDFTNEPIAQDMIFLMMKKKNFTEEEVVSFSINADIAKEIMATGWAYIALPLWGHADPDREFNHLDEPIIEVNLTDEQKALLSLVAKTEKVTRKVALQYFMIFTMQKLGYHI